MPPAPLDPPATELEHYFTLEEFRAEQDLTEDLASDVDVEANRALAEEILEHATGAAWIPRRAIEAVSSDSGRVRLRHSFVRELEGMTYGDVALDGDGLLEQGVITDGRNLLLYYGGVPAELTYTYGFDSPPLRIRRAAMIAARIWTLKGPVDDRATQISADGSTINLSTPGVLGAITGIPEVDATIHAYSNRASIQ